MNNIFFAWLDYETGGLNGRLPNGQLGMDYYPILEVALIVTDGQLHQVGEPLRLVIHHSEERIAQCSEWAIETHTKSGLLDEVRASKISLQDAEHAIISHLMTLGIKAYDKQSKTGAILAGSSIQFDRSFMMCQMPELNDYLHYRQLDVSTFNIAVRQFAPHIEEMVKKEYKHEALADIQETIFEFKQYVYHLFKSSDTFLLDYLDGLNKKNNDKHNSKYGWQIDWNHNRISLNDMGPACKDVRQAISEHMRKKEVMQHE
ncbi:TPA: oligoribonuclease [Vibrio cholerae]|nr:oligoribonuclease [Vibrio cholerae]